jgi:hypothetical protein
VIWEREGDRWVLAADFEEPTPESPLLALVERTARAITQEGDGRVLLLVNTGLDTLPGPVSDHLASGSLDALLSQVERVAHVGLVSTRRRALLDRLAKGRGVDFVRCFGDRGAALDWLASVPRDSHPSTRCERCAHQTL